jgi:hypothetical protein
MAFMQIGTIHVAPTVTRYSVFEGDEHVSIRLPTTGASLCMSLAEAEVLRDRLSAVLSPADEVAAKDVEVA